MARRRFAQLPRREPAACFRSSRHRLFGRINSALPDGTFRDWRSGEPFFRRLHWGALALPILLESAIFIRLHRLVVLGRLLDWLTTSVRMSRNELVTGPGNPLAEKHEPWAWRPLLLRNSRYSLEVGNSKFDL